MAIVASPEEITRRWPSPSPLPYNGGSAESPELAMLLFTLDTKGAISEDISEAEFRKMLNRATRNMMYQGGTAMRMSDCKITDARDRLTGECSGGATHKGEERHLVVFLWIESGGVLVLAAFISVQPTEEIRDTIDHMMRSVGPD